VDSFQLDDSPLPTSGTALGNLAEQVFVLYRQLAKQRDACDKEMKRAAEAQDTLARRYRVRLATVGAEAFHLRRCVSSLTAAMQDAGLTRELARLELLVKRFNQVLQEQTIEVHLLDGVEPGEDLAEVMEVLGAVPMPVERPRIRETVAPLVKVDGEIVLPPTVIMEVPRDGPSSA
jgi:hypothetical protein